MALALSVVLYQEFCPNVIVKECFIVMTIEYNWYLQCYITIVTAKKMDLSLSRMRQLVVLLVFSSRFITINMKGPNKYIWNRKRIGSFQKNGIQDIQISIHYSDPSLKSKHSGNGRLATLLESVNKRKIRVRFKNIFFFFFSGVKLVADTARQWHGRY